MPIDPQHQITLAAAAELTKRFRDAHTGSADTLAGMYDKGTVDAILQQAGCVSLRIYMGTHADGRFATVLVGVDANNTDMVNGLLAEEHLPCPPLCDATSPLRQG